MNLLYADRQGNIYDHPDLLTMIRRGDEFALPRPDELIPLPDESELFLLPNRRAVGLNEETGEIEVLEELAVAAFIAPGYTLSSHPAYISEENAQTLPLFAYGAVGMIGDNFYVAAKKVDMDDRQVFANVSQKKIVRRAKEIIAQFPDNRLIQHLMHNCVMKYACPAARNLCLGRYEAPIPTSKVCNAQCIGCISFQEESSKICASPQNRMSFTPTKDEILELMLFHSEYEKEKPIFSFGQGCEGEPLTQAQLLIDTVKAYRDNNGKGTVNLNSNASLPDAIDELCKVGLSSLRISLNSTIKKRYACYYRPKGYSFDDVEKSMEYARKNNIFISFNLLYFPCVTDTEEELERLIDIVTKYKIDFIQLRNLNIDPEMYIELIQNVSPMGPAMGLTNFIKRLRKNCPWLKFGYFNPYIEFEGT